MSNIFTEAIADSSDFVQYKDTEKPDLYNPAFQKGDRNWGLEIKASNRANKGGESHNPTEGWLMIANYQIVNSKTIIVQVEVAYLVNADWTVHERRPDSERTRTAVTKPEGNTATP